MQSSAGKLPSAPGSIAAAVAGGYRRMAGPCWEAAPWWQGLHVGPLHRSCLQEMCPAAAGTGRLQVLTAPRSAGLPCSRRTSLPCWGHWPCGAVPGWESRWDAGAGHGRDSHREGPLGNGLWRILLQADLCPGKEAPGSGTCYLCFPTAMHSPAQALRRRGGTCCLLSPAGWFVWGTGVARLPTPCSPQGSCCGRSWGWGSLSLAGAPAGVLCPLGWSEPLISPVCQPPCPPTPSPRAGPGMLAEPEAQPRGEWDSWAAEV